MDILLLGAAAIVLIALTVWIVWRPSSAEEPSAMIPPQGDKFEDQYTSATADLSAGGVAVTTANPPEPASSDWQPAVPAALPMPEPSGYQRPALPEPRQPPRRTIGIGVAALLTLCGAIGGAWLYSRWQRQRNKPLERLRRFKIR